MAENRKISLFPEVISASMIEDIWRCETYFLRNHIQRYRLHEKSGDLLAGGAFAKACELTRKSFYEEGMSEDEAIDVGYHYILTSEHTGHAVKTNEWVAKCFKKYFRTYPLDSSFRPILFPDGSAAVEFTFDFKTGIQHPDLPDTDIRIKGKIDGVYGEYFGGKMTKAYVLDEKSTAKLYRLPTGQVDLDKELMSFRLNPQMIIYVWAARELGLKVDTALIRRVSFNAKYEPPIELHIPITQYMIDTCLSSLYNKIQELVEKYKMWKFEGYELQQTFATQYGSQCITYGRACPYAEGCWYDRGGDILASNIRQLVYNGEEMVGLESYLRQKGIV